MLRNFRLARRNPASGLASAFAMAISLAGGAAVITGAVATSASAQEVSKAFREAYVPVQEVVNAPDGNIASVESQFPALVALAQNPTEKFAIGNALLIAGNKLNNAKYQRQGLELQLASGQVPAENIGQYQWFVGNLAFTQNDYAAARTALKAAMDAGYTADDPLGLLVETYYAQDDAQGGIDYVLNVAKQRQAAGTAIAETHLLRALQTAYDSGLQDKAMDVSQMLLDSYASETNWRNSLQVLYALAEFDEQAELDLLRLMRATNSMSQRNEYSAYIANADPRVMANEVEGVLNEAVAAGVFTTSDPFYVDVKSVVDGRKDKDRAEVAGVKSEANSDSTGESALIAGDLLYSLDDFAGAEEYYAMANAKGGVDGDRALTRVGIAQVRQGKYAEAQQTFSQVSGQRAPVAKMWAIYADKQAG